MLKAQDFLIHLILINMKILNNFQIMYTFRCVMQPEFLYDNKGISLHLTIQVTSVYTKFHHIYNVTSN